MAWTSTIDRLAMAAAFALVVAVVFGALLATPRLRASPRAAVAAGPGARLPVPALPRMRFGKLQG